MKRLIEYIREEFTNAANTTGMGGISYTDLAASTVNGFCLLKPGFANHADDLDTMLKNNGWQVISKVKKKLSKECAAKLYEKFKDKDFYDKLCNYMSSDDCVAYMCHKDCKDPIKEMKAIKHKCRDAWGKDEMRNAMHSSDSLENVNIEYPLVFKYF